MKTWNESVAGELNELTVSFRNRETKLEKDQLKSQALEKEFKGIEHK